MDKLIVFVRHGETTDSKNLKFQRANSPLTSESKEIALKASKSIKKLKPSSIIQSTLKRSTETADLLVGQAKIPILTNELFDEIREPESIRGKNISPELSFLDQAVPKYDSEPNYKIENSESLEEFIRRVKKAQTFLLESSDKKIMISSHGFFMRIFLLLSLLPDDMINSKTIQAVRDKILINKFNCLLFRIKGSKFVLEKWNVSPDELIR